MLQETYLGKIKMIYIDPPYNTGHDFVYNDKFSVNADEWDEMSGELDEYGNRLTQNTESNGRFHTDWLNMIYPRLKIARDLLSDDGFIAISIGEEESYKATMIVEHVSYNPIAGEYDADIFTAEKNSQSYDKAYKAHKAVQDYVFTDGTAERSIERTFAEDLDTADEVCVYAKLPKGFHIPTPVGNYLPDWAIAFNEGSVKHIFFVAETKGTMESLNLRPIEQAKISCAKKLFNEMSTSNVKYHDVDSYQSLLDVMKTL